MVETGVAAQLVASQVALSSRELWIMTTVATITLILFIQPY
jgi:hypothetical protein